MVALREHPVPKTQLDSSIFEVSEEDEYQSVAESFKRSIATTTPVATDSSGFSSSSLLQLVRRRDYAGANRVRKEMIQHHLPITPDLAFIYPATYVANSPADPAVRLREFSEWLSLLPVADGETGSRPMFGRLMNLFSNNSQVDVNLVMAFVSTCVSKGYRVKIPDQMIPLIVRFAPPSVSLQFLEDLCSSVAANSTLDKQTRRKIRFWCRTAMKGYLSVGLVEEATKVYQMGLQHGLSLPRSVSRWLERAVTKDPDRFGLSEEIVAALKRSKRRFPRYRIPSHYFRLVLDIPSTLSPLGSNTDPSDPKAVLLRVWKSTRSARPPDPLDVARFLKVFRSQPTTIRFLSAYNQRKPARYRGQWILGEMLYYARRKAWRELIGAFDAYFFRAGVPGNIDEYKSRGRVTALGVQQRLFPSSYHTSLVWMAAVEILQGARPVSMLFKELVGQVTAANTTKYGRGGPSLVSPSTDMFDAGHFTPFLVAWYREQRHERLVAVFDEMCRLGIEPSVDQLSLVASAYAGMSEGYKAVRILDGMEGILKEEGTRGSSGPHYDVSRYVALYVPTLKGFMARKDIPGASLVARRILARGYAEGSSPYIDQMLAKLKIPTAVVS